MPEPKKLKTICIRPGGVIEFIYDDDLKRFIDGSEEKRVFRASHVEPDEKGNWWADLSPIGGPKLGLSDTEGFATRGEALNAEVRWIQTNYLRLGVGNESSSQARSCAEQGNV